MDCKAHVLQHKANATPDINDEIGCAVSSAQENGMASRPKVYLAGPDVFLPDAVSIGRRKKELCAHYGFEGLYPFDNEISGDHLGTRVDLLIYRGGIEVVGVDQDQAETARAAWRRFGKGRHPAGLNYGDCFAYALAKSRHLPLLFRGDDFSQTDIDCVPVG